MIEAQAPPRRRGRPILGMLMAIALALLIYAVYNHSDRIKAEIDYRLFLLKWRKGSTECVRCGGKGEIPMSGSQGVMAFPCAECKGTGRMPKWVRRDGKEVHVMDYDDEYRRIRSIIQRREM